MSAADAGRPPLGAAEVECVRAFLYRRTGMSYGEGKRAFVERRLAERMARRGDASFSAYYAALRLEPGEAEALINAFTVNETYFYREEHQLRALVASILPEIVARRGPGDRVRLWSVPCSTGEEAYSLALYLLENWPLVDAYNVEIVGSDIDTGALEAARAGAYGERATARLPAAVLAAYFEARSEVSPEATSGDRRRLIADLRESVTFTHANLVDAASMAAQGCFDVVFCRNVLIYFDEASRLAAAATLHRALAPGGFLCLGHTESMTRICDLFQVRRLPDAIVYQRPA